MYSPDPRISRSVESLLWLMDPNPYDSRRVKRGVKTIDDIVSMIRKRHGPKAARSVTITVH